MLWFGIMNCHDHLTPHLGLCSFAVLIVFILTVLYFYLYFFDND